MTENKGDLISRKALKKAYFNAINETSIGEVSIIALIDNAPTVESDNELKEKIESYKNAYKIMSDAFENEVRKNERPQGEWIKLSDYNFKCSLCGLSIMDKYNFCPECGAKMEIEQ